MLSGQRIIKDILQRECQKTPYPRFQSLNFCVKGVKSEKNGNFSEGVLDFFFSFGKIVSRIFIARPVFSLRYLVLGRVPKGEKFGERF